MAGQLRVDEITNEAGTGSPSFPNGVAASTATTATTAGSITGTTTAAVPTSALASGTANNTTFLRGDRTWETISSDTTINTLDPTLKTMLIYGTALNKPNWYLSSTTATLAANVTHMVMVVGSGGGGAGENAFSGALRCLGGNGGTVGIKFFTPSSNTTVTITVGAGGAGGNNAAGANGADTTVVGTGINLVIPGGRGGTKATSTSLVQNAANPNPTGADLFFLGGRNEINVSDPNEQQLTGGASLFGVSSTNTRIFSDNSADLGFYTHTSPFMGLSGTDGRYPINVRGNHYQPLNSQAFVENANTNLLSLLFPFNDIGHYFSGAPIIFCGDRCGTGNRGSASGGRGGGGGASIFGGAPNVGSAGGAAVVIIWSFVNG